VHDLCDELGLRRQVDITRRYQGVDERQRGFWPRSVFGRVFHRPTDFFSYCCDLMTGYVHQEIIAETGGANLQYERRPTAPEGARISVRDHHIDLAETRHRERRWTRVLRGLGSENLWTDAGRYLPVELGRKHVGGQRELDDGTVGLRPRPVA